MREFIQLERDLTQSRYPLLRIALEGLILQRVSFMRVRLAAFILVAVVAGLGPARAENRTFIVANNADAYGIDRCLATGARCGTPVATAYCHAREFERAVSFRKVDRDAVTGTVAGGESCHGACQDFIAIECVR